MGRANGRAYGAAVTVTRTSAGCQPDAASEPRCGVTTSSSSRYSPGVGGTVKPTDASAVAPGSEPDRQVCVALGARASSGAAAPPESGTHRAVTWAGRSGSESPLEIGTAAAGSPHDDRPEVRDPDRQRDGCARREAGGRVGEDSTVELAGDADHQAGQHRLRRRVVGDPVRVVERDRQPISTRSGRRRDRDGEVLATELHRDESDDVTKALGLDEVDPGSG